jgi:hypothetical protein
MSNEKLGGISDVPMLALKEKDLELGSQDTVSETV